MARARRLLPILALVAALPASGQEQRLDAETLRARDRMALLDVRTVLTAARDFAGWNGGYFRELRCLTRPESCLPAFPADRAAFLDPTHDWLATRLGYVRRFHPGPPVDEGVRIRAQSSPGSLRSFAFTLVPERPGETGLRAFCGDASGKLCAIVSGAEPPVKDGRCGPPCKELK